MKTHSLDEAVAAEVRAGLARNEKTIGDLAARLGVAQHTAGARLKGKPGFSIAELEVAADFVGETSDELLRRARAARAATRVDAVAS